jgi:hypothetical protein
VNLSFEGVGWTFACPSNGHFGIAINLGTWNGRYWIWVSATGKGIAGLGATIIPVGVVTVHCTHGALVKGVINYLVGTTKTTDTTPVTHCS